MQWGYVLTRVMPVKTTSFLPKSRSKPTSKNAGVFANYLPLPAKSGTGLAPDEHCAWVRSSSTRLTPEFKAEQSEISAINP